MYVVELTALVVAGGLFVLIWMVQLLVYPSFTYYSSQNLSRWHTAYTPRITYIVAPLMLCQLTIAAYRLYANYNLFSLGHGALVLAVWLTTFFIFIPIHDQIQKGNYADSLLSKLVSLNWIRTVLWTVILALEIWHLI